ncbi:MULTISPECIES: polysaccharide biosynthesis/export family protein [Methylocystis]|uniref:Capsular polysaccharide biosynthesis protein n=1 Tax=Methylocystis iwaonis TaxID=2885079 RepID=A0ABM8E5P9_9HYPH|nr:MULTISPECIES: polysaccharide biosynthesis/export family protein [Methylocystis]MDJ0449312.1 polysaccharide biosynthesis/export family protein [Methylocystis sp. JR02]BDV33146.1 capsular polysaccharide biosynthesis protein [Methylocystis iwaonis]
MTTFRLDLLKHISLLAMCGALAACGITPASGPSRDEMVKGVSAMAQDGEAPFAWVEVDRHTLDILARRAPPTLRGFFGDYRPSASQVIGMGDALQITVWEAASGGLFSAGESAGGVSPGSRSSIIPEQIVGHDGSVTVPYAGRIQVAGRTQQQVETAIVERLRGKAIEPQALVNVTRNVTNTVTVTGEVANGARVPLNLRGDRILDVVAQAGGYRSPVHETFISVTRGSRTARAPLQALLANPSENIYVRPGDILTVESRPQTFTVAGAAGANAVIPFDARGITLEEAIGKSGGLNDNRADPDGLFVLRYEPTTLVREFPNVSPQLLQQPQIPVAYHLNMKDPTALFAARRFAVRDKDIIYISNAPLAEIGKVVQLVQMVAQPAVQGMAVSRIGH